jgi:adenosyl cobinamide kinase/adenosyl cobinamide phosphate guanylyltransferase
MTIKDLKPEIKRLYIDGKDVPEICSMFPKANDSTIYTWIRKESWKTLRDQKMKRFIKSPEILMDTLEKMITGLDEKIQDPDAVSKAADSIVKIVKSIKTLSKDKDRLGSVLFVTGELGKHMNDQDNGYIFDEEFRTKFDKLLESFQSKMILKFSEKNFS